MLDDATKTRIENEIKAADVVLFMKGTPVFPNADSRRRWSGC